MSAVRIYTLGEVEVSVLQYLGIILPEHLGVPFHLQEPRLDPGPTFIRERNQYHSTSILHLLDAQRRDGDAVLGITEVDLTIPILTFVFGEALLARDVALVSAHRLRQPFYGLPHDPELLLRRAEKECLHELGHAAGLLHCRNFSCAMAFSNAVEQVDLKEAAYCPDCLSRMRVRWPSTSPQERR